MRQWIVVFLTFRAGDQAADPAQAWIILVVGAVISFLGVPAGLIGNELSIRYGLRTVATLVFVLSAVAGGLFGFTAMLPTIAVLGLSVVAGFIVQGNFSNLTSGVLAVAAPRYLGATTGLYSCIGFGASFPRHTPVRRHTRPIRRDVAARRLGAQLRHLRARLPNRRRRHHFPAPQHLAALNFPGRARGGGLHRASLGYAATGAGAGRAFNSTSATSALRLRPAEIASTPIPMRSIRRPKSSGDAACVARAGAPWMPVRSP